MKKHHFFSLLSIFFLSLTQSFANKSAILFDEENIQSPGYSVGDQVSDFKLKNIDGKILSLSDYTNAKAVMLVFTSNHCPFSKSYEDRIIALYRKYATSSVQIIAINPNDPDAYEEDSFVNMQSRAKEKNYPFPYLADETQVISKKFGVMRTPQVYILKKEADKLVVAYIGAIDDNAQDPLGVTKRYADDALNSIIVGKPVITPITKAVGCAIKWKN